MSSQFRIISRVVAHAEGIKRFCTGEPCMRGHYAERFVSNGNCVECQNWKTPSKRKKRIPVNVCWPPRGLVTYVAFRPLPEEIHAAFLYMEANRWLDAALQAVHDDPELLKHYTVVPTDEEARKAQALLDGRMRLLEAIDKGERT